MCNRRAISWASKFLLKSSLTCNSNSDTDFSNLLYTYITPIDTKKFTTFGGSGEIRTHGAFRHVCFQDRCNKPGSATLPYLVGCTGIEPVMPEAADLQSTESPLILPTQFGATGWIRTSGCRDLQSLALGHSATVAYKLTHCATDISLPRGSTMCVLKHTRLPVNLVP
ncbi:hypothetical protein UFOVP328_151 [uncultured Caudovirales phage]|uniref:Uncharacterized protein n=1 Tax=uncultured Caudovirales phage TaxID=2100421 RepID=A0A6J5LTQ7_9CAUD|nr:hypothetical protein UFOVP328_151 [uncultured Caudovirales phage]